MHVPLHHINLASLILSFHVSHPRQIPLLKWHFYYVLSLASKPSKLLYFFFLLSLDPNTFSKSVTLSWGMLFPSEYWDHLLIVLSTYSHIHNVFSVAHCLEGPCSLFLLLRHFLSTVPIIKGSLSVKILKWKTAKRNEGSVVWGNVERWPAMRSIIELSGGVHKHTWKEIRQMLLSPFPRSTEVQENWFIYSGSQSYLVSKWGLNPTFSHSEPEKIFVISQC